MGHQKVLEQAIKAGRALQSKETRFIHAYYGKKEEGVHQTIPFYENLLFALSLSRLRTVEAMQEAKALLEKLLAYQGKSGLFPVYLHEFPFEHDHYISAALLPPFCYLDHLFGHLIGIDLKPAIDKLSEAALQKLDQMPLHLQAEATGALIFLGKLSKEEFPKEAPGRSAKEIADWITGRRLAGLLEPDYSFWNFSMHAFCNPWRSIRFERGVPEVTLLDLYAAAHLEELPPRLAKLDRTLLQGALCFPSEIMQKENEPDHFFQILSQEEYNYDSYPFYLQWGKEGCALALHPAPFKRVSGGEGRIELELEEEPHLEEKDGLREVELSLLDTPDLSIRVNGVPATVFRIGDLLTIEQGGALLTLKVEKEGEGTFLGHIMKGNRPSEWANAGEERFNAYNRLISFRTIDRAKGVKLTLHWTFRK